jgi:TfoX/Sxy family transcriptional regulator of competence genes
MSRHAKSLSPRRRDHDATVAPSIVADIAARVRAALSGSGSLTEQRMFGGVGFLLDGHLLCHASRKGLMVRVGREREAEALASPHATRCAHKGGSMPGFVQVEPAGFKTSKELTHWLDLARAYVGTLDHRTIKKREKRR